MNNNPVQSVNTKGECSFCERCGFPVFEESEHGWMICPLQPQEVFFQVQADRLYNFVDTQTSAKPTQIYGKRQWKRLLKERGFTDDVSRNQPLKSIKDKPFDRAWDHALEKAIGESIREVKNKPYSAVGKRFGRDELRGVLRNDRQRQRRVNG